MGRFEGESGTAGRLKVAEVTSVSHLPMRLLHTHCMFQSINQLKAIRVLLRFLAGLGRHISAMQTCKVDLSQIRGFKAST